MFTKQLFLGIAAVSIAGAAQANSNNPLDPSYYWDKYPVPKFAANGGKAYVDNRNRNQPSYPHVKVDWFPTAALDGTP